MRRAFRELSLLVALAGSAHAQEATAPEVAPDPRVAAALDQEKIRYALDVGDFRMRFDLEDGRSQVVWVASRTWTVAELEIRDVWSVAARGKGTLAADTASLLLRENARMILGAWQVNQGADEYLVVFSAPIPASADAATLREAIEVVALSTDRIEKQLHGQDEF